MTTADVAAGLRNVNHWIGGRPCASESGRSGVVWNPATGEAQAAVALASAAEVDDAVESARRAFPGWRATAAITPRGDHVQGARAGGRQPTADR